MVGYGSAPGKVILSGEHSVVYGYPALASAIGLRCRVRIEDAEPGLRIVSRKMGSSVYYSQSDLQKIGTMKPVHKKFDSIAQAILQSIPEGSTSLKVNISSEIPIGAGLGSSAAVSVATICAVIDHYGLKYSKSQISEKAYEAEKIAHGTPSGIDNTIATYGGYLRFIGGKIDIRNLPGEIPLIVINSRIPRNTKKLVSGVRKKKDRFPNVMKEIFEVMEKLPNEMDKAIQTRNFEALGLLFDINHGLLDSIGVGHQALSELFWKSKRQGALGSKITGAGGGGCIISLVEEKHINTFVEQMQSNNIDIYQTSISPIGAKVGRKHEKS